jgi:hypothetical protein
VRDRPGVGRDARGAFQTHHEKGRGCATARATSAVDQRPGGDLVDEAVHLDDEHTTRPTDGDLAPPLRGSLGDVRHGPGSHGTIVPSACDAPALGT